MVEYVPLVQLTYSQLVEPAWSCKRGISNVACILQDRTSQAKQWQSHHCMPWSTDCHLLRHLPAANLPRIH